MPDKEILSLSDAAAFLGVSKQTLRRWDKSGRLQAVRHPVNGYRYYRRSDLEAVRVGHRSPPSMPTTAPHLFQTVPADVEANPKLREPQKVAHRRIREHFATSTDPVIVQIPVGCGKTGVIATAPLGIANGRVLVITPNVTIRQGVFESLDLASTNNFWRKTAAISDFSRGPFTAVLDGPDANLHDCDASHFVVTNIQQLASSADRWLPQFAQDYFDMILIDEGHHNVARSWMRVFERFPAAKVISLTATPFRGDGQRPQGSVIYRYSFTKAMVNGYIKRIHSRNIAPEEVSFTYRGSDKKHSLQEVLDLREEAWFRRGVALSPTCNEHIVDASIKYLNKLRDQTGYKHQLIAVACSVDHARQVRSLYSARGLDAAEIHSQVHAAEQERTLRRLRERSLDCIVQVQMLGEGFDHPPLSVAALFRPFRSLSPYIQFVGRIMRVIHQNKPDHPDNHGYLVSHIGLNNDEHWSDFRELDHDDQVLLHHWLTDDATDPQGGGTGNGQPRRFDQLRLVQNEVVADFIRQSFLDPDDDRVLDEFLQKDLGMGGIKLGDLIDRETLREQLRALQADDEEPGTPIPVSPQRRRQEARRRLNERTRSVAARVLQDLGLSPAGRELGRRFSAVAGRMNNQAAIELMHREVNEFLGIKSAQRSKISAAQAESAFDQLDRLGDAVVAKASGGTS